MKEKEKKKHNKHNEHNKHCKQSEHIEHSKHKYIDKKDKKYLKDVKKQKQKNDKNNENSATIKNNINNENCVTIKNNINNENSVTIKNNINNEKNINEDYIKNAIEKRIPNVSRNLNIDLCIAIPSTIISNKCDIIRSYLTSYLARIFTIFSVSKIYIYDDQLRYEKEENLNKNMQNVKKNEKKKKKEHSYLSQYMHYNLQYLETPQYLRKHLFPLCNFLKNSGLMNPVDAPHHLRSNEWLPFREGIVLHKTKNSMIIDVGLYTNAIVSNEENVETGTRVTVLFDIDSFEIFKKKKKNVLFKGKLINLNIPKLYNIYWGYSVELIKNLSDIFKLNIDCIIGTSERGQSFDLSMKFQNIKSILIVFGNKDGLEDLLIKEREEKKKKTYSSEKRKKVLKKILKRFNLFINTCSFQTSRTIRTEEALTITLSLIHNTLL